MTEMIKFSDEMKMDLCSEAGSGQSWSKALLSSDIRLGVVQRQLLKDCETIACGIERCIEEDLDELSS